MIIQVDLEVESATPGGGDLGVVRIVGYVGDYRVTLWLRETAPRAQQALEALGAGDLR